MCASILVILEEIEKNSVMKYSIKTAAVIGLTFLYGVVLVSP